jgi:hypothetical protein
MIRRMIRTAFVLLPLLGPAALHAQAVTGTVVEELGRTPVQGVFVRLLDADGVQRGATLTDSVGAFTLRAPSAGAYTLRAERIGHASTTSEVLTLERGTVSYTFVVPVEAVTLTDLSVTARSRCRPRPESTGETQRLWDEARKVLDVVDWGRGQGGFSFEIERFRQELDVKGLPPRGRARPVVDTTRGRRPFDTPTAAELVEYGFIRPTHERTEEYTFFAPDSEILLSETFRMTHCFWVTRSNRREHSGLVGLAFEPLRTTRLPDIAGVLWLDERTAELRRLEYRYTTLPWGLTDGAAYGWIDFARIPNGAWIMQRWSIRIPRVQYTDMKVAPTRQASFRDSHYMLVGYDEAGGEVKSLRTSSGAPIGLTGATPPRVAAPVVKAEPETPPEPEPPEPAPATDTVPAVVAAPATPPAPAVPSPQTTPAVRDTASAIPLDPISVDAEGRVRTRADVVRERQRINERFGRGRYIWREDFENRNLGRASDLLRDVPGVEFIPLQSGGTHYTVRMTRVTALTRNPCMVSLWVDGSRIRLGPDDPFDLIAPHPSTIEVIEVYTSSSQVPPEYGGTDFGCGVIAITTRNDK